ncbi:AhpD-like protein [Aspergillus pseudoustus]|uniref:AhpD-like protein n=1 Tax=Aspergillus pseudoustus TaxID=1810923 RepID=A0ABR4IXZ2_9EURO
MRLPYVTDPPPTQTPHEAQILARVQERRAPGSLLPLDRALLHSFPVADGWNSFLGAIRTRTSLSPVIREVIICRVAILNGALFEWDHHAPILLQAGFSNTALQVLRDEHADLAQSAQEGLLSPQVEVVLRYTDAITKTITVAEDIFTAVRESFCTQEIVEITATVAAYNCVSRFLVALDVGEKNSAT